MSLAIESDAERRPEDFEISSNLHGDHKSCESKTEDVLFQKCSLIISISKKLEGCKSNQLLFSQRLTELFLCISVLFLVDVITYRSLL